MNPNELPPPDGLARIILHRNRDTRGELLAVAFAREDTGLIIGMAHSSTAFWGIGEGQVQWHFITMDYAIAHLKKCCEEYLGRRDIDYSVLDADRVIQAPTPAQKSRIHM